MAEHPITPPPELIRQWARYRESYSPESLWLHIATQAARWGADQELEACVELWANNSIKWTSSQLRDDRRPKPPSLKKQAYNALDTYIYGTPDHKDKERTYNTIRRALEALSDD